MGCAKSVPVADQDPRKTRKVVGPDYLPRGRALSVVGGPVGSKSAVSVKDTARRRRLSVVTTPKSDAVKIAQENAQHETSASAIQGYGKGFRAQNLPIRWGEHSRPGNDPMKNRKENQDSYVVIDNYAGKADQVFVAVFDGHGPQGSTAAQFVKDTLPLSWLDYDIQHNTFDAMVEGCKSTDEKLTFGHCDCYLSGTTSCASFFRGNKLYIANVGDSRAVLARIAHGEYVAIELTSDHKPDREDERERIEQCGGRVFEWGVPRVWLKNADMPGLAMSRSFGDQCAQSIGVHAIPELSEVTLSSADRFIIWASDGVWEFISSEEAVEIVAKYEKKGPQAAASALVEKSVQRWNEEEDVVDDITVVVAFLRYTQTVQELTEGANDSAENEEISKDLNGMHEHEGKGNTSLDGYIK